MIKKVIISVVVALVTFSNLTAQVKTFSNSPVEFFKELESFLESADKKAGNELMKKLQEPWNKGKMTESQKSTVIRIAQAMQKKRMNAFPNFKDYVEAILSFLNASKTASEFDQWSELIEKSVTKISNQRFVHLLNFSQNFFEKQSIYYTDAVNWSFFNGKYEFGFDSLPFAKLSDIDLKCLSKRDSSEILSTSGIVYPTEFIFYGKKGKVLWKRAGLKENEAYAQLSSYQISIKTTRFQADSSTFYFPRYFKEPLKGVVSDKLSDNAATREVTYPRFSSYLTTFKIPSIFKDVDYQGGLSVHGNQLIGSGSPDALAEFTFYREKKPFIYSRGLSFLIEENSIKGNPAYVHIKLNEDSIVHPGLNFKYLNDKREIQMIRDYVGSAKAPYYNSYHDLDMDSEVVRWNMEENTVHFTALTGSVESKAIFESTDYFREQRYAELQGMDKENPLFVLKQYSEKQKSDQFTLSGLASHYRTDIRIVSQICSNLANLGFILYDEQAQIITLKPRLKKYLLNIAGRADYDVIQIKSTVAGSKDNASLSLLNFDLRMNGVKNIFLSDSQNVVIFPKDQQLVMQNNRNFNVAGRIVAGRFEFFGKKFDFTYDKFKLDMENVDSLRFSVQSKSRNENGEYTFVKVKTVIEQINGDMFIDHPNNKSGIKSLGQYPVFNSLKNSYTFYDRRSILGGVYPRSKFYFQLDPFQVDSLDNFSTDGINFQGTFVSAGIFPDIRENLRVQNDYSLGFIRKTEEEGMPVYGGKGKFINVFNLSHKGLRGDGTVNYLTTTAKSNDFVFYPDSLNAFCKSLQVEAQEGKVEFPDMQAVDVQLHWEPYKPNQFKVTQTTEAMAMYNGETKMNGKIFIGENGMTGDGQLEFASAEVKSNQFKFKKEAFKADTSAFAFTSREANSTDGKKEVAIKTDNVKADVSFKNRMGQFKSNSPESYIEFPVNKYIAYMDELRWYMDKDEVDMNSSSNDIDLIGARFLSVKPDQDSLTFVAPRAKYVLKDRTIQTDGVKLIRVADATIYPDAEKVNVERNAVITTMKNSRINANYDLKYHDIFNATIDILGKKKYKASGNYDFEDELQKTQTIFFSSISVDSLGNTVGFGEILDTAKFTLSPKFEYKGKVKLFAPDKNLSFDGGVKIVHGCEKINRNWLKFKATIDPKNILIPVDSFPKSPDGEKLTAGLVLIKDSTHIYPVFMSRKQRAADQDIITSRGFLRFDKAKQEFQLSSKEKLDNIDLAGDYIAIKDKSCDMYAEGEINPGADLGQVKTKMVGNINHSLVKDESIFDVMYVLDFFFNDECLKIMQDNFLNTKDLQGIDVNNAVFKKNVLELVGKEESAKMFKDLATTGTIKKLPDELQKTIVLSNLKLKWNTETRSYVSDGFIGVQSIGKNVINKMVKGKVEIVKKRGGDILNFYIEVDSQNWYFFSYTRNIMSAISSNDNFNKIIRELDGNKRELKVESGKAPYQYTIGVEKRKRDFVDR